ncbi:large subunit ribosomal protein L25 [Catalinimonas alkaloidigena]|uniref:Large ribosomal subunit protein bL25 n=1 Tax=Catalinimonas alkaloidigena TaxID=1075417 RepID=A0A1G9PKG0_9BACT|nr:50S ribosomal protein L25/general stress protein Ctc [Catalinimonas alkaloidigena]SDL99316.1 large subunit ribosomal protein L25 [Catalinimonas alkaloidigena]
MKSVEIIGFKRANLGKAESKALRAEGNVPCVVYGGKGEVHFYSPMILFRDLVYTPNAYFVELNIEGDVRHCVLQDIQFHPVSEIIMHADFLELNDKKPLKMDIPVRVEGTSPGVQKGGKLMMKQRKLTVKALPKNMPEEITIDISDLDLGKSIKVSHIQAGDFEFLVSPNLPVASVVVPRALRGKQQDQD